MRTVGIRGEDAPPRIVLRGFCAAILLTIATVGAASAATQRPESAPSDARPRIMFVDASGAPLAGPVVDVNGAFPGMAPARATMRLRNEGAAPAAVSVRGLITSGNLGDGVLVTVIDAATGATLYDGSLPNLDFRPAAPIAPGGTATYTLELRWPLAAGAGTQGALTFDLQAKAVAA